MRKRIADKLNIAKRPRLPLSVYLSYLVVVTLLLSGVTMSKYVSTVSASDSAQVAKFDVQLKKTSTSWPDSINWQLDLATDTKTGTYTFDVVNNSEVTVSHTVKLDLGKSLPSTGLTVKLDGKSVGAGKKSLTLTASNIAPGEKKTHTVVITSTGAIVSAYVTDMDITVDAVQVD